MSSGLSVAEPKYFFPAALATTERPVDPVPVEVGGATVVPDTGEVVGFVGATEEF